MQPELQLLVSLAAIIAAAIGGVWKLTRVENALRDCISEARLDIEAKQNQHLREIGETIAAIRQKVADVELYAANNYVRRDSFYKAQENIEANIRDLGNELKKWLERMEKKIDSKA